MNQYLKIILLSVIYYVIYLVVTLFAIPTISSLTTTNEYAISAVKVDFFGIPIGYVLMLCFAAITIFAIDEYKRRKSDGK